MLSISPPILVASGIISTTAAQLLLKRAAHYDNWTSAWLMFMGVSACFYVLSFLMYSQMLRHYELNRVYPATMIGQIILIAIAGLMIGEELHTRQVLGLACGVLAVYLLLS